VKIIREGFQLQVNRTDDAWWVGKYHVCPRCGCEVQLEREDPVWPHESCVSYLCPEPDCGHYVPIDLPPPS
jgi:hypothetical protein